MAVQTAGRLCGGGSASSVRSRSCCAPTEQMARMGSIEETVKVGPLKDKLESDDD
jgi:hypothetical protein